MADIAYTGGLSADVERVVDRQVRVAALLPLIVPPEVERDFHGVPNTCILSSRVGAEVCRHYGIRFRALPVSIQIFNPAMLAQVEAQGHWPRDQDETRQWERKHGAWAVGVGATGESLPGRWDAHLCLLGFHNEADDRTDGLLIDLTLHQASRPRHQIQLEPHSTLVQSGFLGGEPFVMEQNGCAVRYRHFPEAPDFSQAPDWADRSRREFPVKRAIAKLDLALASEGL